MRVWCPFLAIAAAPSQPRVWLGIGYVLHVQSSVDVFDAHHLIVIETTSAQSNAVDSNERQRLACRFDEGRDVLSYQRSARDKSMLANGDELLNAYHAFNDRPIFNGHVSRNVAGVGDDDVVADAHIVGKVTIGHQWQSHPTLVTIRSVVPRLMVTYRRMTVRLPISTVDDSPLNFKS